MLMNLAITPQLLIMKPITPLPLLVTLLCTVACNSGQCAAISDNRDLKAHFHNTKFDVSESGMLKKSEADTIPESELAKIKGEDIESISVIKDIITVMLKNGDSVISKKENYIDRLKKMTYSDTEKIFTKLEEEATYPGGPSGWLRYLNRTFRYPKEAENKGIQGTVIVQFIVDKEGKVSYVESISGPTSGGLREEAERVIKRSGKWTSGKQNGQAVTSYKKQPLTFRLEPH